MRTHTVQGVHEAIRRAHALPVLPQERYLSVQAFTNIADNCFQVCMMPFGGAT